jgi:AraC family transcriptional regulator, regulatory protein of adaptative response / DNA-3-methyladenine glycosylase II
MLNSHDTDDMRYSAMQSRDARFDGRFFVGVTSTGIYCRPICRVKVPKRANCRFFSLSAQAESEGFRPCLRCRPELAPGHSLPAWSHEDASHTLALQAAQLLTHSVQQQSQTSVSGVAAQLGVSERHLRRIMETHLGAAPLQLLQTQRLLAAKAMLTDTQLPVAQVALSSGFGSVRSFNTAFEQHYRLSPLRFRKTSADTAQKNQGFFQLELGFRPPYQADQVFAFWQQRQLNTIEFIANYVINTPAVGIFGQKTAFLADTPVLLRTVQLQQGNSLLRGWVAAQIDGSRCVLRVLASDSLAPALPALVALLKSAFDLDAEPGAIAQVLGTSFQAAHGLRVPGSLGGGFEIAVRAILGQQVTVAAGRTLTHRVVQAFGEQLATPWPQLTHCFPTPQSIAKANPEHLGSLGIVRQRQAALIALAQAVASGQLDLSAHAPVQARLEQLESLPGIGSWTAQYIAMRALRHPDAWPAGDVALHSALGLRDITSPLQRARAAQALSQAWRPWRSYAVLALWQGLHQPLLSNR